MAFRKYRASCSFTLCWTCYILIGSAEIVVFHRKIATENGMRGNRDRWDTVLLILTMQRIPPIGRLAYATSWKMRISLNFNSMNGLQRRPAYVLTLHAM